MAGRFTLVGDGCYRIEGWANGYVLTGGGRAVCVDAPPGDWVDHLDEIGVECVGAVLATHHHRDTLSNARTLVARGAGLIAPAAEVYLIADAAAFWQSARTYVLYNCDSQFTALTEDVAVERGVTGGDVLEVAGLSVRVVDLPGHTRGGVGYVIEVGGRRWLFIGDAMSRGGCVHNWHDFHWGYMDFNTGHRALREALPAVRALEPERIAPAHGAVIEAAAGALDALDANLGRFIEAVEPNRVARSYDEIRQVSEHVYFLGMTTYVIVADSGKAFVWDFGYVNETRGRLERLGTMAGMAQIDVLSMSHYHDDHILRMAEVAYALGKDHTVPRSQIWCHRVLHDVLTRPWAYRLPCLIPTPLPIDRVLDDGWFEWEGIELGLFHMPGQTYWHAGLVAKVDGRTIAFTGDNIWKPGDRDLPLTGPIISRNRYLPGCGHDLVARHLIEQGVDMICPAHNEPFDVRPDDLQGYADWSGRANDAIRTLAGHDRLGVDAWWCRIDPFHVVCEPGRWQDVSVVIDSPFDAPTKVSIDLAMPDGWAVDTTARNSVFLSPGERDAVRFRLRAPDSMPPGRVSPLTADVTVDGTCWGPLCEGVAIASRVPVG